MMFIFGKITCLLLTLLVFISDFGSAQMNAVTLWQFGQGRLLAGAFTLPMQPLGTASDRTATTYLYQVLNQAAVITTSNGAPITQTTFLPTSRTIVASASGWNEPVQGIVCSLVNATFGQCSNSGTLANSGAPTPSIFAIATSSVTSAITVTTIVSSATETPSAAANRSTATKAIVGGAVGGFVFILIVIVLILFKRRWQRNHRNDLLPRVNSGLYFVPDSTPRPSPLDIHTYNALRAHPNILPTKDRPKAPTSLHAANSEPRGNQSQMEEIVDRVRMLETRVGYGVNDEPLPVYETT
ncbi:hypothetical protein GYMLUDRAFT_990220 [Collybiopsis luxurians FD-317 M1]|uniref:Mid2 domain-containing protein n=1 Tax=Collybiopsis luxurians FD-317 M1 TaxID=944289 RepID=A0A0D0CJ47_9AGAR|nr:hypothetical protein GYMLUDRAFT_990220 [Collybiopsis luxurians FD-317 M1]